MRRYHAAANNSRLQGNGTDACSTQFTSQVGAKSSTREIAEIEKSNRGKIFREKTEKTLAARDARARTISGGEKKRKEKKRKISALDKAEAH